MKRPKKSLVAFFFFCLFFSPGISSADYLMTVDEMAQARECLTELETRQQAQTNLLKKQADELVTLKTQLAESKKATESSVKALAEAETRLNDYEKYLTESKSEEKRTRERIKRQRTAWAVIAGIFAGIAASR